MTALVSSLPQGLVWLIPCTPSVQWDLICRRYPVTNSWVRDCVYWGKLKTSDLRWHIWTQQRLSVSKVVEVKLFVSCQREGIWLRLKGKVGGEIATQIHPSKTEKKVHLKTRDAENCWWPIGARIPNGCSDIDKCYVLSVQSNLIQFNSANTHWATLCPGYEACLSDPILSLLTTWKCGSV